MNQVISVVAACITAVVITIIITSSRTEIVRNENFCVAEGAKYGWTVRQARRACK